MILINFYVKAMFNMFQQFSNTFGLVKYSFDGSIQKTKVLRFFCGSVYLNNDFIGIKRPLIFGTEHLNPLIC